MCGAYENETGTSESAQLLEELKKSRAQFHQLATISGLISFVSATFKLMHMPLTSFQSLEVSHFLLLGSLTKKKTKEEEEEARGKQRQRSRTVHSLSRSMHQPQDRMCVCPIGDGHRRGATTLGAASIQPGAPKSQISWQEGK